MIKNIVFDLGNVLLEGSSKDVLNNIEINDDEYNELVKFFDYDERLDTGELLIEDYYNSVKIPKHLKEKYREYLVNYYEYRKINFDLVRLLNELDKNGYRVYVISDNNISASKYYQKNLLFKNIKGWIFSCDYGSLKKDGKLFNIFLEKYNLFADECYFIDDNKTNIKVADKLGFKTFLYNHNYVDLIRDLSNYIDIEKMYVWKS
jgi:putative hydrolase of the HAD superfamily